MSRSTTCRTGCTPIGFRRFLRSWPCTSGPETPRSGGRPRHGRHLIERFLESGWRVVVVGGVEDTPLSSAARASRPAARLDRQPDSHADDRAARAGRSLYRLGFRPGSPGGLGGHAFGHLVQRDQPAAAMAAVVAAFARAAPPCSVPALPSEGLPARRPSLHVGPEPRSRLPGCAAAVVSHPPGGVAAFAFVNLQSGFSTVIITRQSVQGMSRFRTSGTNAAISIGAAGSLWPG